ncbi:MAG: hypothetical protein P1P67_09930, partial [Treponema phagedenis]|uniref:hypothetical protein n=1 Tax=Treponema phagedenis TaxID=162 RepID=UPI003133EE51
FRLTVLSNRQDYSILAIDLLRQKGLFGSYPNYNKFLHILSRVFRGTLKNSKNQGVAVVPCRNDVLKQGICKVLKLAGLVLTRTSKPNLRSFL